MSLAPRIDKIEDPTQMSDELASKLGHKRYFSDIASGGNDIQYANGNRARLTDGTGTISSVPRGYLIPKQMKDGAWVVSGRYAIILSAGVTTFRFHIAGITFKNVANFNQAVTVSGSGGTRNAQRSFCQVNDDSIQITFTSAEDVYFIDIHEAELEAKPNFVY